MCQVAAKCEAGYTNTAVQGLITGALPQILYSRALSNTITLQYAAAKNTVSLVSDAVPEAVHTGWPRAS